MTKALTLGRACQKQLKWLRWANGSIVLLEYWTSWNRFLCHSLYPKSIKKPIQTNSFFIHRVFYIYHIHYTVLAKKNSQLIIYPRRSARGRFQINYFWRLPLNGWNNRPIFSLLLIYIKQNKPTFMKPTYYYLHTLTTRLTL